MDPFMMKKMHFDVSGTHEDKNALYYTEAVIPNLHRDFAPNIEIQMFKIQNSPRLSCSGQRPLGLAHWHFGDWNFV